MSTPYIETASLFVHTTRDDRDKRVTETDLANVVQVARRDLEQIQTGLGDTNIYKIYPGMYVDFWVPNEITGGDAAAIILTDGDSAKTLKTAAVLREKWNLSHLSVVSYTGNYEDPTVGFVAFAPGQLRDVAGAWQIRAFDNSWFFEDPFFVSCCMYQSGRGVVIRGEMNPCATNDPSGPDIEEWKSLVKLIALEASLTLSLDRPIVPRFRSASIHYLERPSEP